MSSTRWKSSECPMTKVWYRNVNWGRRRWEDNIKMDLQDVGGRRGDWMELAQDWETWRALVGTVRDFRIP